MPYAQHLLGSLYCFKGSVGVTGRLRALDAELKSKFGVGPLPQQTEG